MLKQIALYMGIGLCCITTAIATEQCALSLSGPSATSLECSPDANHPSTVVLTFTVKNHTDNPIKFTPSLGGADPSPSSLAIVGGTCSRDTVKAHSSCTVDVVVTAGLCSAISTLPQIFDASITVTAPINQTPPTKPFTVTVTGPQTFLTIASGLQPNLGFGAGPELPLLAIHNANNLWETLTLPGSVQSGALFSSTCSNNTDSATCLAVGKDTTNEASGQTLLYASQDGGLTWALPIIPQSGVLYGAACNQTSPATCWVVGQLQSQSGGAVVLSTTDGGNTWTSRMPATVPPGGLSSSSVLYGTACDASGNCFAIGRDASAATSYPGFIATATQVIPFVQENFIDADCAGSVCVAVGYTGMEGTSSSGFLTLSQDNWATNTDIQLGGNNAFLTGVACTQTTLPSPKVQCVAVGYINGLPNPTPLLYINKDVIGNANNWMAANVPASTAPAELFSAACSTDGTKPICVVGGYQTKVGIEVAVLWQTLDLTNWADVSPGVDGPFYATACTKVGANIICTAAGAKNQSGNVPLYYVNEDVSGVGTWAAAPVSSALPASGCFSNAGASGSSTGSLLFPNLDVSVCDAPILAGW